MAAPARPAAIRTRPRLRWRGAGGRAAAWLWHYHTTLAGKIQIGGWALATAVSMAALDIPVYLMVCAWTAPAVTAWCVGFATRARVRPRADLPHRAIAGQPFRCAVTLENTAPRAAHDAGAGWFGLPAGMTQAPVDAVVRHLPPHARDTVVLTLAAARRGVHILPPLRAYTLFPFGFFRVPAGAAPPGRLLVRPAFHPLEGVDLPPSHRYQPGGVAMVSDVGESPEYIGNREYRPGDATRRLDFRSWARLAKPVVREYQEEYYCRVALVLDTRVPGARQAPPGGFPAFEAAVGVAAAAADALSRGEYLIDLFAAGPELYTFRAGRHLAHLDDILDILAGVEHCAEDPFGRVAPALAAQLPHIAAVVFVLLDWDPARERLARAAAEAGCRVKVVLVRDGDPTRAPRDGWAGGFVHLTPAEAAAGGMRRL